jgi:hypothetical protein
MKVVDFSNFLRINEAEEGPEVLFPSIFFIYFDLYMNSAPYVGGYKDTIKDIKSVQQAKLEDKPAAFEAIIKKVVDQIGDDKIKGELSGAPIADAFKSLKEAFDALLSKADEEEKKMVQSKLSDICFDQIDNLVNAVKSIKESYFFDEYASHVFEKNTFKDERSGLISKVVANIASLNSIISNPPTERIKSKLQPSLEKLNSLKKELEDDAKWGEMKRRARVARLEEIPSEIQEVINTVSDVNQKELIASGVEKKVLNLINTATTSIKDALNKANEFKQEQIEVETKKAEEEKIDKGEAISTEKLDTEGLSEIVSGKTKVQNLQKKGPNFKQIKKVQEAMLKLFPEDTGFKTDGLYGKNTETMVAKVAGALSMLNPDLKSDGKKMTPLFQAAVIKLAEGDMEKLRNSLKAKIEKSMTKKDEPKEEPKEESKEKSKEETTEEGE